MPVPLNSTATPQATSEQFGPRTMFLDLLQVSLEENPDPRYLRALLAAAVRLGWDPEALYSEAVESALRTSPPAPPYDQVRPAGPPPPPTS